MTEDQTPRSDAERGEGQLLTDAHSLEAPISTEGPADQAPVKDSASSRATATSEAPAGGARGRDAEVAGAADGAVPIGPTPRVATSLAAPRRWSRRVAAFLVACGLVVGAVGLTVAVEEQRSRDSRSLVNSEQERLNRIQGVLTSTDVVTKTVTTPGGARLTAVFSASHIAAVLTYEGLPALPAKKTYEIFRVRDDKTKPMRILAAGELSGTALILGVGDGDALVFTIEPEGGSGQPTGKVAVGLRLS
jgi:hypothetical protein